MKKIMLIDPQIKGENLWIDFYDADFASSNGNQYICELSSKQVLQILNSNTLIIDVDNNIINKLQIKTKPYYNSLNQHIVDEYYIEKEKK